MSAIIVMTHFLLSFILRNYNKHPIVVSATIYDTK